MFVPVFQDKFQVEVDGKTLQGNSFRAALCSLLGQALDQSPPFERLNNTADYWLQLGYWLAEKGYELEVVPKTCPPVGYSVANGIDQYGRRHSVVCFGGAVAHDPNPSGDSNLQVDYYLVLLPVNRDIVGTDTVSYYDEDHDEGYYHDDF